MRTAATTLLAALALTGCGSDEPATVREPIELQRPEKVNPPRPGKDRPEPEEQPGGDALTAAAQTAEAAMDGTLVGIGREPDGSWEVDLLSPEGVELRVTVSADGSSVVERRRDDTDADDRAENRPLLGASLTWGEAVDAVAGRLPGPVAELGLDEDDGQLVWEVGTGEEAAGSTYLVDARSGRVLGPEQE